MFKLTLRELNKAFIGELSWKEPEFDNKSVDWNTFQATLDEDFDPETEELFTGNPWILASKVNSEDNPTWSQAMNGPDSEKYWDACEEELNILSRMDAWEIVTRPNKSKKVLGSTWAFKCKRYPDGTVRKLKSRFFVRGDQQTKIKSWTTQTSSCLEESHRLSCSLDCVHK